MARSSVQLVRAPAPVVRIQAPRPLAAPKRKARSRGKASSKVSASAVVPCLVGGAVLGMVEKSGVNIPTIPVLGRAGTLAVLAYFWSRNGGGAIAAQVACAAASVAGYQLAKSGKVEGDDSSY